MKYVLKKVNKNLMGNKRLHYLDTDIHYHLVISKEYNINIATVNKAVNVLVGEGIAFKKRGIGMFVCEGAVQKLIEERRQSFKQNYIVNTLKEAKRLRYTVDEIRAMVLEVSEQQQQEEQARQQEQGQ